MKPLPNVRRALTKVSGWACGGEGSAGHRLLVSVYLQGSAGSEEDTDCESSMTRHGYKSGEFLTD